MGSGRGGQHHKLKELKNCSHNSPTDDPMILYDMMMIIYDDDHHRITPRWKFVKKNLEFSRNEILAGNCVNDYAWKINGSNISSNGFMVHLLFLQKLSLISKTSYVTIFSRQFFRRHNTGFF